MDIRLKSDRSRDVLAIGNAPVDVVAEVDDEFLRRHGIEKNHDTLADDTLARVLRDETGGAQRIPGGSAANTACCLSSLGLRAGFVGRIAADEAGNDFRQSLEQAGVVFHGRPPEGAAGADICYVLTTPDLGRTFVSCHGVQDELSEADIPAGILGSYALIHIESYPLAAPEGFNALSYAACKGREAGCVIGFTPSDPGVIERHPQEVRALLELSDIYIANNTETSLVTGQSDVENMVEFLQSEGLQGAVTMGADGAVLFDGEDSLHCRAEEPAEPVVNTNGVGDWFAAGYYAGILKGFSMAQTGRLAVLTATQALCQTGARPACDMSGLLGRS